MKITYNGHACFTVESEGYSIVLDPYEGVRGFEDIDTEADEVICSHGHHDHAYTKGVKLRSGKTSPFGTEIIECYHDGKKGLLRGKNRITILSAEGKRVAHFGDLGHELSKEQIEKLKGLDCVMIPVGGFYTIDAETAVKIIRQIEPRHIIPMHYKDGKKGLEVVASCEDFVDLLTEDEKEKLLLVKAYGETAEI